MKIRPIIDKYEIKGIQNISSVKSNAFVEHNVPGMHGSLFQDLGDFPMIITITGSINYSEFREDILGLETLRDKFRAGDAVLFAADITTGTELQEVLIKEVRITESEKYPGYFNYIIELIEHPPQPEGTDEEVQADINQTAQRRHDRAQERVVNGLVTIEVEYEGEDIEVLIYDSNENLVRTVSQRTPDGLFVAEDLPAGSYTISVRPGES